MNRFERWSVWTTSAVTAVTGLGLLWTKYFIEPPDAWAVVNHPLEPWLLKAHILAAPLLVFAIGLVATRHIWRHWLAGVRLGRRSGLVAVAVFGPMVVTGYLIQVITHEGWVAAMAISHIVFGILYCVGLTVHQILISRWRSDRSRAAAVPRDGRTRDDETTDVSATDVAGRPSRRAPHVTTS